MKQITLCMVCLLLTLGMAANPASMTGNKRENIRIRGSLVTVTVKSLTVVEPVEAYYTGTAVELIFNQSLDNLSVTITGKWGLTFYSNTVNVTAGSCLVIPTENWSAGTYTIRITNGQGGSLEGSFVK